MLSTAEVRVHHPGLQAKCIHLVMAGVFPHTAPLCVPPKYWLVYRGVDG